MDAIIQAVSVYAIPVLLAITLHEAAHGYIALRCGDQTAKRAGRITLNPVKHIDPVGTVLVPLSIVLTSAAVGAGVFLFGWAKPVPVDFSRLNDPRRDMRYVAFAGPGANFIMAFGWAAMFKGLMLTGYPEPFFMEMAKAGIVVNLVLAALNLLPILPLDGGRILITYLPTKAAYNFSKTEQYGLLILIALLLLNVLPILIQPVVTFGLGVLSSLFNI
ncbi:MAG: site-2 protease family protein [Limnobacter sp.]|nr:site-2 protease family protein [Limnobacter sp.]